MLLQYCMYVLATTFTVEIIACQSNSWPSCGLWVLQPSVALAIIQPLAITTSSKFEDVSNLLAPADIYI